MNAQVQSAREHAAYANRTYQTMERTKGERQNFLGRDQMHAKYQNLALSHRTLPGLGRNTSMT